MVESVHFGVGVSRRPDGTVTVSYEEPDNAQGSSNPVVADLKQLVMRQIRGEHIAYEHRPAHWRIATIGD